MATSKRKRPAGGSARPPAGRTASAAKAPANKTSAAKTSAAKTPATKTPAKAASARQGGNVTESAGSEKSSSASKRLFDLRWLIAGMFVVYGIILSITGIFDNQAEITKAAGVRINLWTGIGMFIVGLVFAAWARWRPLRPE
jgi:hypothetical protein